MIAPLIKSGLKSMAQYFFLLLLKRCVCLMRHGSKAHILYSCKFHHVNSESAIVQAKLPFKGNGR